MGGSKMTFKEIKNDLIAHDEFCSINVVERCEDMVREKIDIHFKNYSKLRKRMRKDSTMFMEFLAKQEALEILKQEIFGDKK